SATGPVATGRSCSNPRSWSAARPLRLPADGVAAMIAIDAHAHVIVPELLRDAAPEEPWRPSITTERGRQVVELSGRRITSAVHEFVDLDVIRANLDQLGIGGALR